MDDLRYPIGPHQYEGPAGARQRAEWIDQISAAPARLRAAVDGLTDAQLDTPYRPQGWTVRQVVHHLPDSHLNSYTRFRLALTEDTPTIRPYDEGRWAELSDARSAPCSLSLDLLDALHRRWVVLLQAIEDGHWCRLLRHPEHGRLFALDEMLSLYAWHGRHHVAHVEALRKRLNWTPRNLAEPA